MYICSLHGKFIYTHSMTKEEKRNGLWIFLFITNFTTCVKTDFVSDILNKWLRLAPKWEGKQKQNNNKFLMNKRFFLIYIMGLPISGHWNWYVSVPHQILIKLVCIVHHLMWNLQASFVTQIKKRKFYIF